MKIKSIALALIITIMYSCGSKKATINNDELVKEINSYVSNVDSNYNLKKEIIEGALTDADGFNDIGTFKFTVFFDDKTKEVCKIENIEKTKETLTEIYYFKNNKFVFVKFNKQIDGTSKLYIEAIKNGKTESLNFYKDKAKRFQKSFEQNQ